MRYQMSNTGKLTAIIFVCLFALICFISVLAFEKIYEEKQNDDVTQHVESETRSKVVKAESIAYKETKELQTKSSIEETEVEIETETEENFSLIGSKDWSSEETYMLAKIVECEAGNQSLNTRKMVVYVILNRVWSKGFPNTIKDVIFEKTSSGMYQFSPVGNGMWEKTEPSALSYKAVEEVQVEREDNSKGVIFFDTAGTNSWQFRNREMMFQLESLRFYR